MSDENARIIELPRSRLAVENDLLTRTTFNGQVVGSHRLSDICSVSASRTVDAFGCVMLGASMLLPVLAKLYIPWPVWSWIACVVLVGPVLFCLCGILKRRLVVETEMGTVRYDVFDSFDEAQGFAVSLSGLLREHRTQGPLEKKEEDRDG